MTDSADFSSPAATDQEGALQIMFTGDVHLGPAYDDPALFDEEIRRACGESHYVVINVEGPITSSPPMAIPGHVLHSDCRSANVLYALGNNVFDLANNHILDHGVAGLRDTIQFAEARGWLSLGAGENLALASAAQILRRGGVTVGLLAVCGKGVPFAGSSSPGVFGDVPEGRVRSRIRELRKSVRWLVVAYHGGEEYSHVPMPARRRKLMRYLRYGADVVVAHHAHCVQRYEQVGEKCIFYGLGNMVFDLDCHREHAGTDESVLLCLSFSDRSMTFRPLFTRHDRDRRTVSAIGSNPNFSPLTASSYKWEWGIDASRRLKSYWDAGHEGLSRNGWRDSIAFYWKKLRRVGGLVVACKRDKHGLVRPYILGGVMHHLRLLFHPGRRAGRS